jgi:hypothetical protein
VRVEPEVPTHKPEPIREEPEKMPEREPVPERKPEKVSQNGLEYC